MAINTSKTYLFRSAALVDSGTGANTTVTVTKGTSSIKVPTTYSWFGDVNNIPQLRGDKEMLEATTLSDTQVSQIAGIFGASDLQFEINLPSAADLDKLEFESDDGKEYAWLVYISQLDKGYVWRGGMSFTPAEFGVNEVAHATVTTGNTSGVFYVGQQSSSASVTTDKTYLTYSATGGTNSTPQVTLTSGAKPA